MNPNTRNHVSALVDQLPQLQLATQETLLQSILDPSSRKLALAPIDDEPFTEEVRLAVAKADDCLKNNEPIPLEHVPSGFGLSMSDWVTMTNTPLSEDNGRRTG